MRYLINLRHCLLLVAFLGTHPIQAGEGAWFKKVAKVLVRKIPGIGGLIEETDKDRLEEKIDCIQEKQKTGLDKLQDIARQAIRTKERVEEIYYFKEQSKRRAEDLVKGLKSGNTGKFLGALVESWIGVPINPAEYIPDTAYTRKLKNNLELDLSSERGLVQQYGYFLSDTRAALLEQGLRDQTPEQFNQSYEEALLYEQELEKALSAKRQATIRLYKEEISKLEHEISVLELTKKKQGLTIGDVMQVEIAADNKRHIIRELNEKITEGIKEGIRLTDEQQAELAKRKAQKDAEELANFLREERIRIHEKYGHLWNIL
jgi:hypothetical protein